VRSDLFGGQTEGGRKMKVSVVVLNYNGKDYVGDCVGSVLDSSFSDFEVVVLDNASIDGSFGYLKRKYGRKRKVKLFRSEKQLYFTGGCNFGASKAVGEKVVFLNSDTVVDRDFLKEMMSFAGKRKKILAQPKILFWKDKRTIDNVGGKYGFWGFARAMGRDEKDRGQYDFDEEVDYVNGTVLMIDRKFFWELGGFDEWYKYFYEDVDLNLRAKKKGGSSFRVYKALVYHKGSLSFSENVASDKVVFNYRKNRLMTLIKNSSGLLRVLKMIGLVFASLFLKNFFLTLRSFRVVLNHLIGNWFNKLRLRELRGVVGSEFKILDLGCGEGGFLRLVEKEGLEGWGVDEVFGCGEKIKKSKIESFKTNSKFDVVSMYHVLEHLEDPEFVLERVKGWLKKDGFLVLEVPLVGNMTERILGRDYFAYFDKTHKYFFRKRKFFELIEKKGWRVVKKGVTWQQFPFTVISSSFRKGFLRGVLGLVLWFPLKFLSVVGLNDEILRVYCVRSKRWFNKG